MSRRKFNRFVHEVFGPALHEAGARDLRTYTFIPSAKLTHNSPGVSHEYPAERRYHGGLVIGAGGRSAVDDLLKADAVAALIDRQAEVVSAAHAYTVERSTTVIDTVKPRSGPIAPVAWRGATVQPASPPPVKSRPSRERPPAVSKQGFLPNGRWRLFCPPAAQLRWHT